jgi:protein farnesyltransferase subunit beta
LIDSCYSHWVGSIYNIVNNYFEGKISIDNHLLYLEEDLQKYVIFYCQDLKKGGLWDKPGKNRDIYHTCYALSGVSASQDLAQALNNSKIEPI